MTVDGLITAQSRYGPKETLERLVSAVSAHGMTILARINHAAAAAAVGIELRPTEVVIFGNPKAGTPLMQAEQRIGIDLPLKALVWEDSESRTWLSYNDPMWLAKRHGLSKTMAPLNIMADGLATVAKQTLGPQT